MVSHQHSPIEFFSDAYHDPLFVKCEDCGQVLHVSHAMPRSADESSDNSLVRVVSGKDLPSFG